MLVDVREGESGWEKAIGVPLGISKASEAFLKRIFVGGEGRLHIVALEAGSIRIGHAFGFSYLVYYSMLAIEEAKPD